MVHNLYIKLIIKNFIIKKFEGVYIYKEKVKNVLFGCGAVLRSEVFLGVSVRAVFLRHRELIEPVMSSLLPPQL